MGYEFAIEVSVPIDGSGKYVLDGEEMKFVQEFSKNFPKVRGRIIDISLAVERNIEQVILRAKRQMELTLIFDKFGGFTKDYIFYDKWQDFRTITKDTNFPIKNDYKNLRRDILSVISIRNKYTHGNLYYDGGKKTFFIQYEEDGKKEAEVSEKIIEDEIKMIDSTLKPTQEITNFFDKQHRHSK